MELLYQPNSVLSCSCAQRGDYERVLFEKRPIGTLAVLVVAAGPETGPFATGLAVRAKYRKAITKKTARKRLGNSRAYYVLGAGIAMGIAGSPPSDGVDIPVPFL